jgi:hypothetical protein
MRREDGSATIRSGSRRSTNSLRTSATLALHGKGGVCVSSWPITSFHGPAESVSNRNMVDVDQAAPIKFD